MSEQNETKSLHIKGLDETFDQDHFVNPEFLYYKIYHRIPNSRHIEGVDRALLRENLIKELNLDDDNIVFQDAYSHDKLETSAVIALTGEESIVSSPSYHYNSPYANIYYSKNTSLAHFNKLEEIINKSKKKKDEPTLYLLSSEDHGLDLRSFAIKPMNVDVKTHYNDDFLPVHQLAIDKLNKKDEKGIFLLHGEPGTGKTSYIRHLIGCLEKKMIYIPLDMSEDLADPKLIQLLSKHPDSVLIIEDAESVLIDRGTSKNSAISNLLNIADGLLSDCLNIQLICTFNVDISKIDNALLRKGRIIASYEFEKLSIEKTGALLREMYQLDSFESLNLAQIYNYNLPDFEMAEGKRIGFG